MKRLGFRWAVGLAGAGAAAGAAWMLAVGGGVASAQGGQDDVNSASAAPAGASLEGCDDACVRSRGVAALLVLSQRPPQ